jgi:hypothetical protein
LGFFGLGVYSALLSGALIHFAAGGAWYWILSRWANVYRDRRRAWKGYVHVNGHDIKLHVIRRPPDQDQEERDENTRLMRAMLDGKIDPKAVAEALIPSPPETFERDVPRPAAESEDDGADERRGR